MHLFKLLTLFVSSVLSVLLLRDRQNLVSDAAAESFLLAGPGPALICHGSRVADNICSEDFGTFPKICQTMQMLNCGMAKNDSHNLQMLSLFKNI